jgi:fatty aldehyde decarbonylase
LNPFSINECCTDEQAQIWGDVLAQAATGEQIGAMNYETLAELYHDAGEKAEALEHAAGERGHAAMFRAAGRDLGIEVAVNPEAQYWKRIRSAFLARAEAGDLIDCIVAQEVMLESFAVASYEVVAAVAPGKLGSTFGRIAAEEAEHVAHAIGILQAERARDPGVFDARVHRMHEQVMTALAEMVAREDPSGHCGLCNGSCVKASLPRVGLRLSDVRGTSLRRYLKTLDEIGVPGERSLGWIAQLPV